MQRMNEIRKLSEILDQRYIPSEQNQAELSTITQAEFKLIHQKLFYGPETTSKKALDLMEINIRNTFEENLEIDISLTTDNNKTENCNSYQIIKWDSYSSWDKLVHHLVLIVKIKQSQINSQNKQINK